MDRQHADDSDWPVGQPVRRFQPQVGQKALGPADARGLEHRDPRHGLAPGRDHVGHDHGQGEKFLKWKVAAHHQPGDRPAQADAEYRDRSGDQERVHQRLVKHVLGDFAAQQLLPVVERPVPRLGPLHSPHVSGSQLERGDHHLDQRDDYQTGEGGHCGRYHDIVRASDSIFNPVFCAPDTGIRPALFHSQPPQSFVYF